MDKLSQLKNFKNFIEKKELDSKPKPKQVNIFLIYQKKNFKN